MAHGPLASISSGSAGDEKVRAGLLAKRRYNREYMRRRRADPRYEACERENRQRWDLMRKLREACDDPSPYTNERGEPVCGLCRRCRPMTEIVRLRVAEGSPHGYVEVRIPYCGQC